jgi:hypothetical protein
VLESFPEQGSAREQTTRERDRGRSLLVAEELARKGAHVKCELLGREAQQCVRAQVAALGRARDRGCE